MTEKQSASSVIQPEIKKQTTKTDCGKLFAEKTAENRVRKKDSGKTDYEKKQRKKQMTEKR